MRRNELLGLKWGDINVDELVIHVSRSVQRIKGVTVYQSPKTKAGCRVIDLRHTHATLMFRQGVLPKVVRERLGHGKISTTLDIYSHYIPSLQKNAVEKFEEALRN